MKDENKITQEARERLWQVLADAELKTVRQMIQEVALALDVTELQGLPLDQYYETLRRQLVDKKLKAHADYDPNVVSVMSRLWEKMKGA